MFYFGLWLLFLAGFLGGAITMAYAIMESEFAHFIMRVFTLLASASFLAVVILGLIQIFT